MTSKPQPITTREAMQIAIGHHAAGRLAKAAGIYRQVRAAEPANADAVHLLGVVAHQSGDSAAAVELIGQAIALDPANPVYLNNLGEAYRELDRPQEAARVYRRALALKPDYADACSNLGNALKALGRFDEAADSYRRAIELNPALARAGLNLSILHLLRGDYATGFALYENRFAGADARQIDAARDLLDGFAGTPRWQGEDLRGKALVVWTEQGFGDSLMMMRYLPLLKARGLARLTVYCAAPLVRLIQALSAVDEVVSQERAAPAGGIDYHCSLMSLPFLFGTRLDSVPAAAPCLQAPDAVRRQWADRLAGVAAPRIGLVWAGGQRSAAEAQRSMRLETCAPLFEIVDARFVSLQKEGGAQAAAAAAAGLFDAMDDCADFLDTAALVQQLDLVISVDTAVAHLAGALGKPVWLLNRHAGAWQWLLERDDSPWYPSMRIFRRRADESWDDVMARVAAALRLRFEPAAGAPVKLGQ